MHKRYGSAVAFPVAIMVGLTAPLATSAVLEEVVVTARKREESLQTVPVAVTALGAELIREKSIENPYDLSLHVPGLTIRQGGADRGSPDFFIRGQGATFGTSAGVVVYFNDAPLRSIGLAGSNIQLYDLQSIQVLKGPQGTLFGRSSTGGAVLYDPRRPSGEFGGYLDVKIGNLDLREYTGAVDIPILGEKLTARAAFNVQRREGFTESQSTGQELDERHSESYRLGIDFRPTEWLDSYTLLQASNVDAAPTGAVLMEYNPNNAVFNTTPFAGGGWFALAMPPGIVPGQQGLCYAINPGNPAAAQSCIDERIGRINTLVNGLAAERDRVAAGGSIRKNLTARENYAIGRTHQIFNTTSVDLGTLPFVGDITLKNIFSTNRVRESNIIREFGATQYNHGVVINNHDLRGMPQEAYVRGSDEESSFRDDWTEEFQILGTVDDRHSWILGYFTEYFRSDYGPPPVFNTFNNALTVPLDSLGFLSLTTSETERRQTGYFGQATVDLGDLMEGLSFTAGYRRTESESKQTNAQLIPGANESQVGPVSGVQRFEESAPSWTVSLDYQVSPDLLVYLAHRRGFKPGGINSISSAANVPGVRTSYDPETLDDIELGFKSEWSLGGISGRSNAAFYNSWYENVQRTEILPAASGVVSQTNNIAEAEITGLELENQIVLSDQVQLLLNYAWTDARYTKWPGFTTNIYGQAVANENSPFTGVAEHQGTIGLRYVLPLDPALGQVSLYGEYYRQSGVWLDDEAILMLPAKPGYQEGYENVNLRVDWNGLMGYPLDASLFVRNALDEEWLVGANSLINALGFITGTWNEPRTFGLQVRYRFGAEAR